MAEQSAAEGVGIEQSWYFTDRIRGPYWMAFVDGDMDNGILVFPEVAIQSIIQELQEERPASTFKVYRFDNVVACDYMIPELRWYA